MSAIFAAVLLQLLSDVWPVARVIERRPLGREPSRHDPPLHGGSCSAPPARSGRFGFRFEIPLAPREPLLDRFAAVQLLAADFDSRRTFPPRVPSVQRPKVYAEFLRKLFRG
jgi:hypothetical protein